MPDKYPLRLESSRDNGIQLELVKDLGKDLKAKITTSVSVENIKEVLGKVTLILLELEKLDKLGETLED
jgi:hypothetical protein